MNECPEGWEWGNIATATEAQEGLIKYLAYKKKRWDVLELLKKEGTLSMQQAKDLIEELK